jgi:hypothetical protein
MGLTTKIEPGGKQRGKTVALPWRSLRLTTSRRKRKVLSLREKTPCIQRSVHLLTSKGVRLGAAQGNITAIPGKASTKLGNIWQTHILDLIVVLIIDHCLIITIQRDQGEKAQAPY